MENRIIQFLKENNLTSTKFADIIGVQRSSISHLLSGRNKPSFDFIEKMLIAFPSLNAQWLITGNGSMYMNIPRQESLFDIKSETINQKSTLLESSISKQNDLNSEITKGEIHLDNNSPIEVKNEKKIERIIIFYIDGTFKQYKAE